MFVADVTLPDGGETQVNRRVLKTWRVRDTGDTTWDKTCPLVNASTPFGAGRSGGPVDNQTRGHNRRLRGPDDARQAGHLPLHLALAIARRPTVRAGTFHRIAVISLPGQPRDNAERVADVTIPAATRLAAGAKFTKVWKVRNTGGSPWGEGYRLAFLGDNAMDGPAAVPLPHTPPGHTADLVLELIAPSLAGRHRSSWQCISPTNEYFGDVLTVEIDAEPMGAVDMAIFVSDVTIPMAT